MSLLHNANVTEALVAPVAQHSVRRDGARRAQSVDARRSAPCCQSQLQGAISAPLPFAQSVALIWPQVTGLIAAAIGLFTIAYVAFQRQEVRA